MNRRLSCNTRGVAALRPGDAEHQQRCPGDDPQPQEPAASAAALVADLLAFDPGGALGVTDFGGNSFNRVPATTLIGTGAATVSAAVQVTVSMGALLDGFAFDQAGALWTTFSQGSVARLTPAELTTTTNAGGPAVPETKLTSPDLGHAGPLAFFPGAAGTALYSATQP